MSALESLSGSNVDTHDLVKLLYEASLILKWRHQLEEKQLTFADALGFKDSRAVDRFIEKLRGLADELAVAEKHISESGLTVAMLEPWGSGFFETLCKSGAQTSEIMRAQASFIRSAAVAAKKKLPRVAEVVEEQIADFVAGRSLRPHYSQVATLLSWVYTRPGCGGFKVTEEGLSRRMSRRNAARKTKDSL